MVIYGDIGLAIGHAFICSMIEPVEPEQSASTTTTTTPMLQVAPRRVPRRTPSRDTDRDERFFNLMERFLELEQRRVAALERLVEAEQ